MSTGLLLFLIFLALSIIDSVARMRRSQQQEHLPPPEAEGGEESRAEPSPAQAEGGEAGARQPAERLGELLDLEKLMGPGYLQRLMGPGIAGAGEEEDAARTKTAVVGPAATPDAGPGSRPATREERRAARAGLSPDQERRRAEARRLSRVDQTPEVSRRPPKTVDARARPDRADRTTVPLQDSPAGRARRRPGPAVASSGAERSGRSERRTPKRTRLYRELFGGGDRNSLRRAFVLKEVLDAPASERPSDARGGP